MMIPDPSIIVSLFGKYCKNLRIFDIDAFHLEIKGESTLLMIENCKKLEYLDIPASSKIVPLIYKSRSIKSLYLSYPLSGVDLNLITERMENLKGLSFLKIDGKNDLSFLKYFPNLEYLSIGDFDEMDDEGFLNVSKTKIVELILVRTPKISDEALRMLGSMQTLTKFNIRARLPNVTQEGWINLVKRPIGHPSWRIITIDDGRQINPEFFEILDHSHHNLEHLRIRGFSYDLLLKDDSFNNLKFEEAWIYYKNNSHVPTIYWPIIYNDNHKKFANIRMREALKKEHYQDNYSFKQDDAYEGAY
ncbi:hypothetical protein C1645_219136 [Glomus cerebriforme]|uniref:F-box domain-containing protein n=1 Tax=Glomus cerebriforme TaxID=658196 RepID=A0A397ST92_9GLOM|nr:hypothetical protein C1645_219136 [Glomus cerebriforme]